jgi:hypothetical protein
LDLIDQKNIDFFKHIQNFNLLVPIPMIAAKVNNYKFAFSGQFCLGTPPKEKALKVLVFMFLQYNSPGERVSSRPHQSVALLICKHTKRIVPPKH